MLASILTENVRNALAFHHARRREREDALAPCNVQARHSKENAAAKAEAERQGQRQRQRVSRRSGEAVMAAAAASVLAGDGWALEARSREGDVVESRRVPGRRGKVFRLTATFPDTPPHRLWEQVKADSDSPGWFLDHSRTIEVLEEGASDVLLQRSAAQAGGLVPGREFLVLRRWERLPGGGHLLALASTDHSAAPPSPAAIRGDCGPGGWLVEPAGSGGTRLRWVVDCALGGWLPIRMVDSCAPGSMLEYSADLRARFNLPSPPRTAES